MILTLSVHYSRVSDLVRPDHLVTQPSLPIKAYRDGYGNWCTRIVAPAGRLLLTTDALVRDTGETDVIAPDAPQHAVQDLPEETLLYLLGSRYCETELLSDFAWSRFSGPMSGWARVQAISEFVHHHITFGYQHASSSKTAWQAFNEQRGVCRDFAHLGVTLCRCMNIPARYCTGYLGDIGVPATDAPMDFSGWFEAFVGGRWYTFDPRNLVPRVGRVLIAQGRDAADVAISTAFGRNTLETFRVWTDQVPDPLQ
jgi:transglutaminase-like putative cysteine protease